MAENEKKPLVFLELAGTGERRGYWHNWYKHLPIKSRRVDILDHLYGPVIITYSDFNRGKALKCVGGAEFPDANAVIIGKRGRVQDNEFGMPKTHIKAVEYVLIDSEVYQEIVDAEHAAKRMPVIRQSTRIPSFGP